MSRSKSRSPGQKYKKTAESSPLTVHSKACAVGVTQQAATDDAIAWLPSGDGLCRWENQRMLSSLSELFLYDFIFNLLTSVQLLCLLCDFI